MEVTTGHPTLLSDVDPACLRENVRTVWMKWENQLGIYICDTFLR